MTAYFVKVKYRKKNKEKLKKLNYVNLVYYRRSFTELMFQYIGRTYKITSDLQVDGAIG